MNRVLHWPVFSQLVCLPLQMVDLVRVLALLPILLVGLILQHLHPFPTAGLIFAGLSYWVQLAHLILHRKKRGHADHHCQHHQQTPLNLKYHLCSYERGNAGFNQSLKLQNTCHLWKGGISLTQKAIQQDSLLVETNVMNHIHFTWAYWMRN